MPGAAEIIGIYNAITVWTCTHCSIDTIILVHLYNTTLEYLSTAYKGCLNRIACIEEAVYLLGYIYRSLPCLAVVLAVDCCNEVRVLACGVAVAVNRTACNSNDKYLITCAVGNYCRVAECSIEIVLCCRSFACTDCNINHVAPCLAVVVACTANNIHLTVARVGTAHKTCRGCYQTTVACSCDTRDAVRRNNTVALAGVEEVLLHRSCCSLYICNLDSVTLNGNVSTIQYVAQHCN